MIAQSPVTRTVNDFLLPLCSTVRRVRLCGDKGWEGTLLKAQLNHLQTFPGSLKPPTTK